MKGECVFQNLTIKKKRTNESFLKQENEEYHLGVSLLADVPNFGIVSHIPLEYMNLVCIGVAKK